MALIDRKRTNEPAEEHEKLNLPPEIPTIRPADITNEPLEEDYSLELADVPTIRIVMLGASGSGKTSFISGVMQAFYKDTVSYNGNMYQLIPVELKKRTAEKSPIPEGLSKTEKAFAIADYVKRNFLVNGRFIGSTQDLADPLDIYFEFYIDSNYVCNVVISDYAGELISSNKDYTKEDADNRSRGQRILADHVDNSDAVFMIVDGTVIEGFERSTDVAPLMVSTGLDFINMYSANFILKQNVMKKTILVTLTKSDSDKIPYRMKEDNFASISKLLTTKVCKGVYNRCTSSGWRYGVIPVSSIGADTSVSGNNVQGFVEQKNIDLTMIYAIYYSLDRLIAAANDEIARVTAESNIFNRKKNLAIPTAIKDRYLEVKEIIANSVLENCRAAIHCKPAPAKIAKKL